MITVEKSAHYYQQVYDSIRRMIIQGVWQPGERIYEAKLAREIGVSRSPVRESVRALEKEGLLVLDEKSRITVYKPNLQDVEEIYQCRMALESLAAKLAARLATPQEKKEIENVLLLTKQYLVEDEERNKLKIVELNSRFHNIVIECSRNKRLQKQLHDLRSLIYYYMTININGENRRWDIYNDHQAIFECIAEGLDEKAGTVMEKHIEKDLDHLKQMDFWARQAKNLL